MRRRPRSPSAVWRPVRRLVGRVRPSLPEDGLRAERDGEAPRELGAQAQDGLAHVRGDGRRAAHDPAGFMIL